MVTAARLGPAILAGVAALILGRLTMLQLVGFWDTAELQTIPPLLGTAHPTGFPTYVILGWFASVVLSPFGEPAFRMNLLSVLSIAVAAAVTVDLVRVLTRSTSLAVAAGIALAATPVVWRIGSQAETHSLHLVFVAVLLRLLVGWESRRRDGSPTADRWLVAAAVVFGLSVGNHSLTLLLAPPVGLYVLAVDRSILRRPAFVAMCTVALVGTIALVYAELPLRAGPFRAALVYGQPETWGGFWYVVLGEQFRASFMNPFADVGRTVGDLLTLAFAQLGPLAILVPAGLVVTVQREPRFALLTGSALAITIAFNVAYVNADIERYYAGPLLIAWVWLAMFAAAVVHAMADVIRRRAGGARRVTAAAVIVAVAFIAPTLDAIPARRAAIDRSAANAAARWLDDAFERLAPDAVVVSWWSYSTTLWYGHHVEGRRPDIEIVDDRTLIDEGLGAFTDVSDANLGRRPVYVIRADASDLAILRERYVVDGEIRAERLLRILGRQGAQP